MSWEEEKQIAQDWDRWKETVMALCSRGNDDDDDDDDDVDDDDDDDTGAFIKKLTVWNRRLFGGPAFEKIEYLC